MVVATDIDDDPAPPDSPLRWCLCHCLVMTAVVDRGSVSVSSILKLIVIPCRCLFFHLPRDGMDPYQTVLKELIITMLPTPSPLLTNDSRPTFPAISQREKSKSTIAS
ncbi:hypothetical protein [Absidia glauca]|uniref:Uncharacterized protein n=1 Tax=Absidia glauca TaxID=4829 RepID=A0A163ISU4_ABSGL|nr:hypothetical protein [Absidia glauca]